MGGRLLLLMSSCFDNYGPPLLRSRSSWKLINARNSCNNIREVQRPCKVYQTALGHLSPCVLLVVEPCTETSWTCSLRPLASSQSDSGRWLSVGLLLFCCLANITLNFLLMYHINVSCIDGLELRLKEFCMFFINNSFFFKFLQENSEQKLSGNPSHRNVFEREK